jgi:hypothetical protein
MTNARKADAHASPSTFEVLVAAFAGAPTTVLAVGSTPEPSIPEPILRAARGLRGSIGEAGAALDDGRTERLGQLLVGLRSAWTER